VTRHPDTAPLGTAPDLTDARVVEYLRRHPDFLITHPELLRVLASPTRASGDGVVDMQTFMIERLRAEVERLIDHRSALVAAGRAAHASQTRVQDAVVAMMSARSLEHLLEIVTVDFLDLLRLDVVTLCVENGVDGKPCAKPGVRCVEPGLFDAVMGDAGESLFLADTPGDERLFGAGAGLARSAALLRIDLGANAPPCLLALGARAPGVFPARGDNALYAFLARALEHCLRLWLDLPR